MLSTNTSITGELPESNEPTTPTEGTLAVYLPTTSIYHSQTAEAPLLGSRTLALLTPGGLHKLACYLLTCSWPLLHCLHPRSACTE